MKNRLYVLLGLLLLALSVPFDLKASHAAGGEIIYENRPEISDSTYRVFFKFYRDCGGAAPPPAQQLCYYSSCNPGIKINANMTLWTGQIPPGVPNGSAVTLGCSGSSTECSNPPNGQIPGVEEWWYSVIITLPYKCDYWTFSTGIGDRNGSNNITSTYFFIETTFNNNYAQGNNSPYFDVKPVPYTCKDLPYFFNNQAVDPDGDSLWTEVIIPLDANYDICGPSTPSGLNLSANPPIIFPGNPFQTGTAGVNTGTFALNNFTGQISFTATEVGPQTLAIRVKEYRNGVLIGSIIRDVQVQVLDPTLCNYTPSTINPGINLDSATLGVTGQILACQEQQMKFCFDIATTDPEGILIISDNSASSFALAGMTVTYTGQRTKTVRGCVTWKPGANQTGLRNLIIRVKDSTCHPPGIVFEQAFTLPIIVNPHTNAFKDTTICPGDQVQLNAIGGGNFQWTEVNSSNNNTLSCTNCTSPIVTPYATKSYAVESISTNFCKRNKDTVDVIMLPTPQFTKIGNHTICPGSSIQYDLAVIKDPGVTYTYAWTPAQYLNNNTIENPKTTPLTDVTYRVVISASNNRCKSFDTSVITVLDGFAILSPDSAICLGDSVNIRVKGDPAYTYAWRNASPTSSVKFLDPAAMVTNAKPAQFGKVTLELTASHVGCQDSIANVTYDVQPIPEVIVSTQDQAICYGDTLRLGAIVNPVAYNGYKLNWSPSAALNDAASANPTFTAFSNTTLVLTASTSAGCNSKDSVKLTALPADFLTLSDDDAVCPGQSADITLTGVDVDSMWWDENSPYISDRTSWTPVVSPVVTHAYTVYGIDKNGCHDTQSVNITVKPAAVVSLPDTVKIYPGDSYKMNPSGNALHFSWFPPVGLSRADIMDPVAKPEVNTRYFVTAVTEAGCTTTDSVSVMVVPDSYLDMPNAFSPGRDGNGVFRVLHLGRAKLVRFSVYNRWGVKMFETTDISQGWDGRYNGESQPMGVYIYTVEAAASNGKRFSKQGNVTLIR